ncbi:hypothetical protein H4219_005101 [Mycoemilia scoparia]|uniref:SAP domain-containing protein n=1 Tax=Mycoemilia scoparia TaxID=417184 RepID=A0A9W7ZQB6_9FUNG|nr:hypothetical protein H4219_005101 [Mycoemilia scoparia]
MSKTPAGIYNKRKQELVEIAAELGISAEGTRADILERIKNHTFPGGNDDDDEAEEEGKQLVPDNNSNRRITRGSSTGSFNDPMSPFVGSPTRGRGAAVTRSGRRSSSSLTREKSVSSPKTPSKGTFPMSYEEEQEAIESTYKSARSCILGCPFKVLRLFTHVIPESSHYKEVRIRPTLSYERMRWPVSLKLGYFFWIIEAIIFAYNSLGFHSVKFGPYPFYFIDAYLPAITIQLPALPASLASLCPVYASWSPFIAWFGILTFIPFVFGHWVRPEVSTTDLRKPFGCMDQLSVFSYSVGRLSILYLLENNCETINTLWAYLPYEVVVLSASVCLAFSFYEAAANSGSSHSGSSRRRN